MKNLKKVLALVLAFACAFTMFAGAAFTDSADIQQSEAVEMLSALGVINGYTDGSFKPNDTITRAEAAKMIYTIRNGGNDDASAFEGKSVFTDVYSGHWAEGYINFCYTNGIINGKGNSKFAPDDKVTGTELAKMLLICMGYQADKSGLTGTGYTQRTNALASQNGLYDEVTASVTAAMPRQYAAQIMYNALKADTVTWSTDANDYIKTETTALEEVQLSDGSVQMVTVTANETMGNKWMKLETVSITLTAVEQEDGRDTYSLNGEFTRVASDYSNLLGQKVNVMTKDGDHSKVYGVYADEDSQVLATGTVGQLDSVSSSTKTKLNGTEYKLENRQTATTYAEVAASAKGVLCPNVGTVSDPATLSVADLEGYDTIGTVAGTVKLVDNNGNGKADVVVYTPAAVSQLTYVGSQSITGTNGLGSRDLDDVEIYDGYAKDDWTTYTASTYTVSGDTVINKIDIVTAEVEAVKGSTEARVDGTWYKIASDNIANGGDSIDAGSTYALAIVGNYIVNSDETEASSTDIVFVADYASVNNSFTASSTTQDVKAYFLDGSSKTITVEKAQLGVETSLTDITNSHKFGAADLNKLYSYSEKSNGNYELTILSQARNKAGYESIGAYTGVGVVDANQKIAGMSIADEAVVFAAYGAGTAKEDVKVLTGKTVNGWNAAYGDSVMYATKKSNGIEYVSVAIVTDTTSYAGIGSDYLYGYMTSDSYKSSKDGDTVTAYEIWTGSEATTVYYDGTGTAMSAGDILVYTLDGDFINVENAPSMSVDMVKVAITGIQKKSEGDVAFIAADYSGTYSMDEDCVYIAINDDKQEGIEGSSLDQIALAEETTTSGVYYANAWMVYNKSDNTIVAIIYDADNNRLDGPVYVS